MFVFKEPTWSSSLPSSRPRVLLRIQIKFFCQSHLRGGKRRQGGHHAHPKISLWNLCTFASSPHPSSPSWPPPLLNLRWLSVSIPPIHAESAQPLQAIAPWLGRLTVLPAFLPASVHRMQTVHASWQLFIANVRALAHDPIFLEFLWGRLRGNFLLIVPFPMPHAATFSSLSPPPSPLFLFYEALSRLFQAPFPQLFKSHPPSSA